VRQPRYRSWTFVALGSAVVLLATSPAAAVNRDGQYSGTTSQDRHIRFVVDGGEIGNVRLPVFHQACNLTVLATSGAVRFGIADDGTFVIRFFDSDRETTVIVRGEFTSRERVRGTFRSERDSRGCRDVARGTWRAHRVASA
jgi:hypothetical protein